MTKQVHDHDMNAITGGGRIDNLAIKLNRILALRHLRAGGETPLPTPGGPGPGFEPETESSGMQDLMQK